MSDAFQGYAFSAWARIYMYVGRKNVANTAFITRDAGPPRAPLFQTDARRVPRYLEVVRSVQAWRLSVQVTLRTWGSSKRVDRAYMSR